MRILVAFLLLVMASCASVTSTTVGTNYTQLTVNNVENACDPAEVWNIKILPMPAIVLRFDNCAGVDDLLVIVAPTEGFSKEVRELSVRLASIHYVNYLMRDTGNSTIWQSKLVKNEVRNSSEHKQEIFYYVLSSQKVTSSDSQ